MDFAKYCGRHKKLIAPNSKFTVYLGGGMAVKLYLMDRCVDPIPSKVKDTHDYDFTFAVNHPLTEKEVSEYSLAMYSYMYNFIN